MKKIPLRNRAGEVVAETLVLIYDDTTDTIGRAERWRSAYVLDHNCRWIPRDVAEARGEFAEAIDQHDKPSVLRSIITRLFL